MDAVEAMLLKQPVKYQGGTYLVTSTYDDGTVDLDDGTNFIPDVRATELGGVTA